MTTTPTYRFRSRLQLIAQKVGVHLLRSEDLGQGTAEYAILVGVLVVIAIGAIVLLSPIISNLWDGIVSGMSSLG